MHSLRAREDLFAAHEEVVRVGQLRVLRVGHRVERSDLERELVNDGVVSVVLLLDDLAERLFGRSAVLESRFRIELSERNGKRKKRESLGLPCKLTSCHPCRQWERGEYLVARQPLGGV